MKQKGSANIIVVIIVIILLFIIGYSFLIKNKKKIADTLSPENTPTQNDPTSTPTTTPSGLIPNTNPSPTSKQAPDPAIKNWQSIDAGAFSIALPGGWKFNKLQGMDSYVGEFVGGGIKLSFDYGQYSNSLPDFGDPDHNIHYEIIDESGAKVVTPIGKNGTTGVHFESLESQNKFTLYGTNLTLSQQETALKIFHTIKFKR